MGPIIGKPVSHLENFLALKKFKHWNGGWSCCRRDVYIRWEAGDKLPDGHLLFWVYSVYCSILW